MLISSPTVLTATDLLRGDIQLATPPNIYFALKTVIDDPTKTSKDAGAVIETDAALAAKLLKIVNSAFYGFPSQIASIAKAITLVGTRELQNLVLATVVIERFSDLPGEMFSIHDFWAKNLHCALLTRELDAQLLGKKYAESSFLCGLIHNIGQLLFYKRIPLLAREVDLLLQSQPQTDDVELEQQVIGFDHYQAGAELCRLWKLPEVIGDSIALHSSPTPDSPYNDLAEIVRLSSTIGKIDDALIANRLELPSEQLSQILDKTNDEFEAIFKLFYPTK